jgi:hypothetical protein
VLGFELRTLLFVGSPFLLSVFFKRVPRLAGTVILLFSAWLG